MPMFTFGHARRIFLNLNEGNLARIRAESQVHRLCNIAHFREHLFRPNWF